MEYLALKWLHILSSTFLFGTGFGTAFYMFVTNRTGNIPAIAVVTRFVVLADWLFTSTTVIIQPLTGWFMAKQAGYDFTTPWLFWSIVLYLIAGACWLPVVWLQMRMRDMAAIANRNNTELPELYWRYERIWFLLGIPAFLGLVVVFYLMTAKPL